MVSILESINAARRDLIANERLMTAQLSNAYLTAWRSIERKLDEVQQMIDAAIAAGEDVSEAWLNRQLWFQQIQESIRVEFERFNLDATQTLARSQSTAVAISRRPTDELRRSLGDEFAGRINANGFARWVSALNPSSPLRAVIDRYGDRVVETITTEMHEGLGQGLGARTIVRNIHRKVGPEAITPRIETLVRTEMMRAYRGSQRDDSDALVGDDPEGWEWEWLAAKSARTCGACLAMDGRRFPYAEYPDRFHCNCRCTIRLVPPIALVPAPKRPRMTGEEWLRTQPVVVQKRIMRTPAAYEAFENGEPLASFVGIRHNDTWGDSIYLKSAKQAIGTKPVEMPKRTSRAA